MKKPTTILYVEDNDADAGLVQPVLEGENNCSVSRARTLDEAMQTLAASDFDLILLDLMLPDAGSPDDPLEAFTLLHKSYDEVPIVVMTGLEEDIELGRLAISRGAVDFLTKSSHSYLLEVIKLAARGELSPREWAELDIERRMSAVLSRRKSRNARLNDEISKVARHKATGRSSKKQQGS